MFQESQQIGVYTLIRKLGEGGFGEVWLAENRNQTPPETVAVKLPRHDQIDLQAVKDEIFNWILSGKHKNILPFIGCETFGHQIALVSEYAPDGSLQDLIDRKGRLPEREAVEIVFGILEGLAHLHHRKIIHRDLKPDNVLFQGRVPRLTDFGISRAMSVTSQSQTVSGTFSYMAPEAFDGKRNAQTDIWSVGIILYQLLTGNLPFPQNELIQLVGALASKEPEPLPVSISPELQTIVTKALTKETSRRYQTADEMAKDLQWLLEQLPAQTLKFSSVEIPPTQNSPQFSPTQTDEFESVEQDLKFSFKPQQSEQIIRPIPKQKSKTGLIISLLSGIGLLSLLIFSGVYFYFSNKNIPANNLVSNTNSVNSKTTPETIADKRLIPFRKGNKFGFSDENKKIVIEPKYDGAEPFAEGLAIVLTQYDLFFKRGFVDKTGKEVTLVKYDDANAFSDGLAKVGLNKKYGFIDKSGKEIIALKYDYADSFSAGLALVGLNDKYGFVDKSGIEVIPLRYDYAYSFSDDLTLVKLNDKFGFIDKTGIEVIPLRYDSASLFSDGLARVTLNKKDGFINETGNEVIALKYDFAYSFSDGLALVKLNGKEFFIDKAGKEVIFLKYNQNNPFSDGLASVKFKNKYGFIDKTGKEVIPLKYDFAGSFFDGVAHVEFNKKDGFIDKTGKEVVPLKYNWVVSLPDGLANVEINGKEFYIDKNGTEYYEP